MPWQKHIAMLNHIVDCNLRFIWTEIAIFKRRILDVSELRNCFMNVAQNVMSIIFKKKAYLHSYTNLR